MIFSNVLLVFMISLQFGSYDMMIENSLKAFSGHVQVSAKGYSDEPIMRLVIEDIESRAEQIRRFSRISSSRPRGNFCNGFQR